MVNLFLTKVLKNFNGERIAFQTNGATIDPYLTTHTHKLTLKCIIDLDLRAKTIKNIENKT